MEREQYLDRNFGYTTVEKVR